MILARAARLANALCKHAFLILAYLFDISWETTFWNDKIWSPQEDVSARK